MHHVRTVLWLAAVAGLAVGCGDAPQSKVPVVSAASPVVPYPFTLEKGAGVRMTSQAEIHIEASGSQDQSQSTKVGMTLELRCTEVTPPGDRRVQLRMRLFEVDGVAAADANPAVAGSMILGPDRMAREVVMGGRELPGGRPQANPFVTGGLSIYLPLPVGGMRVGETVVLPSEMPANVLPPDLQRAVQESAKSPAFSGTYTLLGTREQEDVLIGEFDIDISLKFSGKVSIGPQEVEVLIDMSSKGRQSFALSTGLPVGSGSSRVTQRVDMKVEGQEIAMRTNADIHAECKPLD